MARMIPDYVHGDCQSSAEKRLFDRFRRELDDETVVLHSLALAKHEKKLRSEIDFVILSSRGVLSIEVKGGRVARDRGQWVFTDRYGEVHKKKESPFDQASGAMFALRRACAKRFGMQSPQATCTYGYAVFFPDFEAVWDTASVDGKRSVDKAELQGPLSLVVDRLYTYSESEMRRIAAGKIHTPELSNEELNDLLNYLRGDFDYVPSLGHHIDVTHRELLRLTEEQYQIVDGFDESRRVLIHGAAGTGKTVLAVRKCKSEALKGRTVLFLCFNGLLAGFISKSLRRDPSLGASVQVFTLHAFAMDTIKRAGLESRLNAVGEGDEKYRSVMPGLFSEAFHSVYARPPFDVLVVDEGQDLRLAAYKPVFDLSLENGLAGGRWAWFEDHQQDIFLAGARKEDNRLDLDPFEPVRFRLTKNCRNSMPIGVFTSMISGADLPSFLVREGPQVSHHFYVSREHQLDLLKTCLRELLGGGANREDIVILSSRSLENSIAASLAESSDLRVQTYKLAPKKGAIRFATIQSFKGLEAKAIILTDVDELTSGRSRVLNYVACSRAMAYLAVLIRRSVKDQYAELARELGARIVSAGEQAGQIDREVSL